MGDWIVTTILVVVLLWPSKPGKFNNTLRLIGLFGLLAYFFS